MERNTRLLNLLILLIISSLAFNSCDKETGLNFFSLTQDREIGETMDSIIRADPVEFPILNPVLYADAYVFMNQMMQRLLQSDYFVHKEDFNYSITIIDKEVMNAFAVPGGKLYFYTGLMKYLDNEANLAGVLAHEMAHVDRRHSSQQLSYAMGVDIVIGLLLGDDKSELVQYAGDLAGGLASLQFSRKDEYEADEFSIRFMDDTDYYHPKGIAGFFEKLKQEGYNSQTFEFLSTHPSDDNRLANIEEIWVGLGSPDGGYFSSEYENFINNLLP